MDKTARLQFATSTTPVDSAPQNVQLMALVIGVMSAVTAEVEKESDESNAGHNLAQLVQQLPEPSRDITPEQVLKIQLAALKANDIPTPGHGISVAHRYCTSESRALLGSVSQFAQLFRDPMYSPLLNFKQLVIETIYEKPDRASIRFTVRCLRGTEARYVAYLVLETTGPDTGCWMTDSILRRCG